MLQGGKVVLINQKNMAMNNNYKLFAPMLKAAFTITALSLATFSATAQWAVKAPIPTPGRDASATFTINNTIYLAGSSASKDFWKYNTVANTWTRLADIPGCIANRGFAVAFALNGKGYVATGADTSIVTVKQDLWQYDTATNTWAQKASLPGPGRDGAFSFVVNNIAYIGGGNDSTGYLLNDFWAYDPTTNSWAAKANLPDYTIFPFAFGIGNYGYISCGQQGAAETVNTYQYDPTTNAWVSKAAFPGTARQAGAAFVLNNIAYCGLGMTGYTTPFQDFYTYNATTNSWASAGNFLGGRDAWPAVATANGKGYVGIGWDFGSSFFSYWYQFTPPVSSVSNTAGNEVKPDVYPNPTTGLLHIDIANASSLSNYTYQLINTNGQKVAGGTLKSLIDISNFPTGEYQLKITGESEMTTTIIKVR
jgi:hypothetical protein